MSTQDRLLSHVMAFLSRIPDANPTVRDSWTIEELNKDLSVLERFRSSPGIYYFIQNDVVMYIGRALHTVGLRARVLNQISVRESKNRWEEVVTDGSTICGLIGLHYNDRHFAPSMEVYIIDAITKEFAKPAYNYRLA